MKNFIITCYCGNTKKVYQYQLKKGNGKYCTKKCANKANAKKLSITRKGKNNPMFGKKPANYKGFSYTKSGSRNVLYKETIFEGNRIKLHRLIMQKHLNRKLLATEIVHHIDGDGLNNSIKNLLILSSNAEHRAIHLRGGGFSAEGV